MKLVRVVARNFVAGFETDGIVRRTAPILKKLMGLTDEEARKIISSRGWRASVIAEHHDGDGQKGNFDDQSGL